MLTNASMLRRVKGKIYVALYVDDNLMIVNVEAINKVITALKENGLVIKIMEGLQGYLSCKMIFSNNKTKEWLGQPHLIKK